MTANGATNGATDGRLSWPAGARTSAGAAPIRSRRRSPAPDSLAGRDPSLTAQQLVVAIVQAEDARAAVDALTEARFRVTQLATSGGFLRKANATLLVGVERPRVLDAVRILQRICRTRTHQRIPTPIGGILGPILLAPIDVQVGGATIFVMDVQHFERV